MDKSFEQRRWPSIAAKRSWLARSCSEKSFAFPHLRREMRAPECLLSHAVCLHDIPYLLSFTILKGHHTPCKTAPVMRPVAVRVLIDDARGWLVRQLQCELHVLKLC